MAENLTSRERVHLALSLHEADRVPRCDSFWPETLEDWRKDGFPKDLEPREYFGFDIIGAGWLNHEGKLGYSEVLEETEEWRTTRNGNGAILRYWKNKSGTPEHIGFTVNSPDSWRNLKKDLLDAPIEKRMDLEWAYRARKEAAEKNLWFCWAGVECFEIAKDVVGHEILCVAMVENPEWIADILETETDLALRGLDFLEKEGFRFDGAWIFGDIAYNHGPFISPSLYRELVQPSHARQVGWFKDRGLKVIYHTDGDFRPLIPALLETGIDCFQPLEAKAGMDVRELKPEYGDRVAFMGNIDATVLLTNDREKIEEEVASKILLAKMGGGYIYHSDHSVPPGVRFETYRYLMELVDKYGQY